MEERMRNLGKVCETKMTTVGLYENYYRVRSRLPKSEIVITERKLLLCDGS